MNMASGNNVEIGRAGREHRKLDMNMHIDRAEEFPLMKLNTRRLIIRAKLFSLPRVPPRSRSVSLDRLTDDEASELGFMSLTMTLTHIRLLLVQTQIKIKEKILKTNQNLSLSS